MANKPQLFLHIGTEKTGTTSIQQFLSDNYFKLRSIGIFTSTTLNEGYGNHRWLPAIAYNENQVDDIILSQQFKSLEKRRRAIAGRWDAFKREVNNTSNKSAVWVLSSEQLHSRLTTHEEISRLRSLLHSLFEHVTVIIYLRKPILSAISSLSTTLKCGYNQQGLAPAREQHSIDAFNHALTLQRWQECFPDSSFRVRLFQKEDFVDGDLISDFATQIGIADCSSLETPEKKNETLSLLGMKYLWHLNQRFPAFIDNKPNPMRGQLRRFVQARTMNCSRFTPTKNQFDEYENFFADSDSKIRAEFFPGRKYLWSKDKLRFSKAEIDLSSTEDLDLVALNIIGDLWQTNRLRDIQSRKQFKFWKSSGKIAIKFVKKVLHTARLIQCSFEGAIRKPPQQ